MRVGAFENKPLKLDVLHPAEPHQRTLTYEKPKTTSATGGGDHDVLRQLVLAEALNALIEAKKAITGQESDFGDQRTTVLTFAYRR